MERITILLPTFDRRHVLERTLDSYLALSRSGGHRLLVIDDGSHDGTTPWLRSRGVEVQRLASRSGLPTARNHGLAAAGTPWVLFGEDDVVMPSEHIARLLEQVACLPARLPIGAVAGRLFDASAWQLPTAMPMASPGKLLDGALMRCDFAAELEAPRPLPSLHACALVRRSAALAIGGYDSRYRGSAFREESDFYARLWRAGFASWLTPATWSVHVRHRLGGGCRGAPRLSAKILNRLSHLANHRRFCVRHVRLWQRWSPACGPGASTARWAWRIISQAIHAWHSDN